MDTIKGLRSVTSRIQTQFLTIAVVFVLLFLCQSPVIAGPGHYSSAESGSAEIIASAYPDSKADQTEIGAEKSGEPFLGIYLDDLTFEEAYKQHYEESYGVKVEGVIEGGPAEAAGLMENDIIMQFNGEKIHHEDHLVRLIRSYSVGDEVPITYFRDGRVRETTAVLRGRGEKEDEDEKEERGREKIDAGGGGITVYTSWLEPEHGEISNLLGEMGFADVLTTPPIGEYSVQGLLTRGFQLQFGIENNWYWGLVFNQYNTKKRTQLNRHLDYEFGYWGFTVDKRVPVVRPILLTGGIMAGFASYDLKIFEMTENYNWRRLNEQLENGVNNFVHFQKKYLIAQPNVGMIVRFTDNIGIQGKVGYDITHSYDAGWKAKVIDDKFEINDSPETEVSGPTYSVGLWFDIF